MAPKAEILAVAGREVTITNPDKVFFAERGPHEARPRPRTTSPSRTAPSPGSRGRPMVLKRFVNGAAGRLLLPEARARQPARLDRDGRAELPVRSDRGRDRGPRRGAARLDRSTSAASTSTRTRCARRTSTIRTSCGWTSTRCRAWAGTQVRQVALVAQEALEAVGLVGWPKTSGSRGIHINVRIEPRWTYPEVRRAALALARDVERRAPAIATSQVVEGGAPRRLPRLQPERQGPHRRLRLLRPAHPRRARLDAPALGRGRGRGPRRTSRSPRCPRSSRRAATRARGSTRPWARLTRCSSCPPRTRRRGTATRPGRRTTASRRASWPGCSPRSDAIHRSSPRRAAPVPPPPTGRRRSTKPLIEIAAGGPPGGRTRGPGALAGTSPRADRVPRAGGRPGGRDARPVDDVDAHTPEPHPCPGGSATPAGAAGPRLRPVVTVVDGWPRLTPPPRSAGRDERGEGVDHTPALVCPGTSWRSPSGFAGGRRRGRPPGSGGSSRVPAEGGRSADALPPEVTPARVHGQEDEGIADEHEDGET